MNNYKTTLIARNLNRALPLKKKLIKKGHKVIIEPVFSIKEIKHKNLNYKDYSAIMFTSATTIQILSKEKLSKNFKKLKTFCVGEVTFKTAKKEGFNCVQTKVNSAKSLEKIIIKFISPNEKKILIIGGKKIAHNPIPGFRNAGLKYERVIIYDTEPIKQLSHECQEAITNKIIDNIIIYSPESAKMFIKLVDYSNLQDTKIICLGKNTGNIFKRSNWKKIQVLNNINLKNFANAAIED